MRVLVTGGAGFIGSYLVDALVGLRHDVTVVDDLTHGRAEQVSDGAQFSRMDVRDPTLEEVFRQGGFEAVFHFAALVDARESERKPALYRDVNVNGSLNVLNLCRTYEVRKFVYASSVAVYGEPRRIPVHEDHGTEPTNPYGETKLQVERHLTLRDAGDQLDFSALRFANVYGPRQTGLGEAGVVAVFASSMIRGERVSIYGTGDQVRDFVWVEDAVAATVAMLHRGASGVYNIGTGEATSVNQLFTLMKAISGYSGEPKYQPLREQEIERMVVNSSRAADELGWKPSVPLKEGVMRTLGHAATAVRQAALS